MPDPIRLDQLPRLSAMGVTATRQVTARVGSNASERRVEMTVPPFGLVSACCLEIVPPEPPVGNDAVWSLARGHRMGHLVMDGGCALRVVAATLGLPAPRTLRPLGAAERGIVTATIVSIFRAIAGDVVVSLGEGAWHGDGLARLVFSLESKTLHERVSLDIPPEWVVPRSMDTLAAEASHRGLGIPFGIDLARTTLTAGDWSRARTGDAVVFDERALRLGGAWPVRITCGGFVADAAFTPDGRAQLVTGFRADDVRLGAPADRGDIRPIEREIMSSDDREADALTVLAAAPIEVVAEIGRLVLRADEVTALRAGSVLTLGPLRPTSVDLVVADRVWARGELVDVDGQLGVRLTGLSSATGPRVVRGDAETIR